jgi:hypothetical protein
MFNAIGQPRFNSPLVRFFGMKIGGAAAPTLAPEIAPSFDVNQMDDPTLPWLRGEQLVSAVAAVSAAPANYSEAALRNPSGSGVIAIVEQLQMLATGQIMIAKVQADAGDLVSVQSPLARDTRWGGLASGLTIPVRFTSRNTSNTAPAAPYSWIGYGTPGNEMIDFPVVLAPGAELRLFCNTVNTAAYFTVLFRVRPLPNEETQTG